MPPKRAKATRASTSSTEAIPSFPPPPTTAVPTKSDEQAHTPERSPARKSAGITQAQKQALVDNLQLEITERARKLRAQYAMQAQGLRTRLELRVNRIPQALRKRNIQELLDEHAEKARPAPPPPVPAKDIVSQRTDMARAREPERKSLKRQSDQISSLDDKENALPSAADRDPESSQDLPQLNPKKRAKTATATATANTKATRTASRKVMNTAAPSNVLSPKSHNSRTLPRSPFKPTIPQDKRTTLSRPISPIKPSVQQHSYLAPPPPTKQASSRAPSRQGKLRGVAAAAMSEDMEGRSSEASTTSAGTTIVTKPSAAAAKKAGPAAKKALVVGANASKVGRKPVAAAKKENVPPVAVAVGGGRTLRKRG